MQCLLWRLCLCWFCPLELKKVGLLIFGLGEAGGFVGRLQFFDLWVVQCVHAAITALVDKMSLFFMWAFAALISKEAEVLQNSPVCLYSSTGWGTRMCLHRPAAAVGGGANGRGWRSDLTRKHHCQMWQGQPLLWSVGEKPPRRGATCETRYETFDVIIANMTVENAFVVLFFHNDASNDVQ